MNEAESRQPEHLPPRDQVRPRETLHARFAELGPLAVRFLDSHGNALDLWATVHSLPLHQAALDLCRTLNMAPPRLSAAHVTRPICQRHAVPFSASTRKR